MKFDPETILASPEKKALVDAIDEARIQRTAEARIRFVGLLRQRANNQTSPFMNVMADYLPRRAWDEPLIVPYSVPAEQMPDGEPITGNKGAWSVICEDSIRQLKHYENRVLGQWVAENEKMVKPGRSSRSTTTGPRPSTGATLMHRQGAKVAV